MISALLALTSYLIVILVGLTCLAVEKKMHMLISTFTKKFHFWTFCADFFVNVFYSALLKIVWEQIFHFQTILGRKFDWKRDMLRRKCFLMSFQGQSRSFGFINYFVSLLAIMWSKMMRIWKCLTKICPHMLLAIWAHLAPQWLVYFVLPFWKMAISNNWLDGINTIWSLYHIHHQFHYYHLYQYHQHFYHCCWCCSVLLIYNKNSFSAWWSNSCVGRVLS